jgi:phosphatidate cytidylyltransferase
MSSNLASRFLVAAVAIPAALVVVYIGGWALAGALAVLCVAGTREVYNLARSGGMKPLDGLGFVGAAAVPFCVFLTAPGAGGPGFDPAVLWLGAAVWLMLVMVSAARTRSSDDRPLASVSVTVFGVLYAGCMLALLVLLRHPSVPLTSWAATWLVFLPLVVVWVCDTLAMTGGSLIGGPKLSPSLSPNKTWAGAISGTLGGMIVAPVFGVLLLRPNEVSVPIWMLVVFGFVISVVGQAGDIAESQLKREVGTKDSGAFFGGHGGVLDRLDSLYWAIPTSVILLALFGVT